MQKIVPSIDDTQRSHTLSLLFRYPYCVQLTSAAFCSSAVGIDKSSLSANAIVGDNVVIAAMEANEVFMKADLSQVDELYTFVSAANASDVGAKMDAATIIPKLSSTSLLCTFPVDGGGTSGANDMAGGASSSISMAAIIVPLSINLTLIM